MCACVGVAEVVHVAGTDERHVGLLGERDQLRVQPRLDLHVRVLQLDVDVVATEDGAEAVELCVRVGRAVLFERFVDAAGEAAGECDHALAVTLQELPVDARLVVVALEVAERGELDQVRVAGVVTRKEGEVRVALLLCVAVVGEVDLAADDRLDAGSLGRLEELHGARHGAVIGERDRRHLELGSARDKVGNPARPVENRVLGVDVQVDEGGLGHREGHSTPASGGPLNRLRRVRKRSSEPRRPDAGPRPQGGHSSVQGGFGRHSAPDRPVPEWLGRERLLLDETRPAAHPSTLERR